MPVGQVPRSNRCDPIERLANEVGVEHGVVSSVQTHQIFRSVVRVRSHQFSVETHLVRNVIDVGRTKDRSATGLRNDDVSARANFTRECPDVALRNFGEPVEVARMQ